MKLANERAEIVSRVLSKCSDEFEPAGPWRWTCSVQNGRRLPISAQLEEGFLRLALFPDERYASGCSLEEAIVGNGTLPGSVKLALAGSNGNLCLQTDVAVLDEKQLTDRFCWAINGFHDGCRLLESPACRIDDSALETAESGDVLGELLRETSWPATERGPNDFTVELDDDSAARVRISMTKAGVIANLELIRSNAVAERSRLALAVFLLSATGAFRFVRAFAAESAAGWSFGMQVRLPPVPAVEEIVHCLAALSSAHRVCTRAASVLLDDAAARCYLAARDTSTNNDQQHKES